MTLSLSWSTGFGRLITIPTILLLLAQYLDDGCRGTGTPPWLTVQCDSDRPLFSLTLISHCMKKFLASLMDELRSDNNFVEGWILTRWWIFSLHTVKVLSHADAVAVVVNVDPQDIFYQEQEIEERISNCVQNKRRDKNFHSIKVMQEYLLVLWSDWQLVKSNGLFLESIHLDLEMWLANTIFEDVYVCIMIEFIF